MNKPASFAFAHAGPARFTTAEFERMCEVDAFGDAKIELVDGKLERMTPPMGAHSYRQLQVTGSLLAALAPEDRDRLTSEIGIDLGNDTVVACDAALLYAPMREHRWLRPDEVLIVIEVAQTTIARDLGLKLSRYAGAGISNYWVIDSDRRVVHVHGEPVGGEYAALATVRFGEPLSVPGTDRTIVID